MKKIKYLLHNEYFWLGLILALGAFLRLWQIEPLQYFTYDQARDYLIIKKMIVDGKFTLVGPTVLTPGVFLPPFYYYSLIPFLWLFNFRLIGPDLYTAFLGIGAILVFYLLVKDLFGKNSALLSSLIFSANPYLIQVSRHAWNPNTIYFYTLLFALAFERYILKKRNIYLVVAAFCFSWTLNLHYTVSAFIPLLSFLYFRELKTNKLSKYFLISAAVFVLFVSPIFLFEIRHNFPNTKGVLNFLIKQDARGNPQSFVVSKLKPMIFDYLKMPLILISGIHQNMNLTVNPSHILLFDKVDIQKNFGYAVPAFKLTIAVLVVAGTIILLFLNGKKDCKKSLVIILGFIFCGFTIRLIFPPTSFYFYHYTFLLPFIFLLIAFTLKKIQNISLKLAVLTAAILSVLPMLDFSLKNEVKNEAYFLPACEIIASDSGDGLIAIAASIADNSRWEKNGLEYRYFLETKYKLPLKGWDIGDYKEAEVLYFIDEKGTEDPLTFGGMEMESFAPEKIVDFWEVKTGQKIYKLAK